MLEYYLFDVEIFDDIDQHVDFIGTIGMAMDDDFTIQDIR